MSGEFLRFAAARAVLRGARQASDLAHHLRRRIPRGALGISIIPPYETYITYDVYITPGLLAMIQLFQGMQSSLSMVYDREMGSMRVLLTTPLPRWFLLVARLFAGVMVSLFQVYAFLLVAYFFGVELPPLGYLAALPALILTGMMFGSLGMLLSSTIKQLENFAGIMNFVIFPMFFASSALYPLWKMREGSLWLYYLCLYNPFTWAVELIRFAFYLQINWQALGIVGACMLLFLCCRCGHTTRPSASSSARWRRPPPTERLASLMQRYCREEICSAFTIGCGTLRDRRRHGRAPIFAGLTR